MKKFLYKDFCTFVPHCRSKSVVFVFSRGKMSCAEMMQRTDWPAGVSVSLICLALLLL